MTDTNSTPAHRQATTTTVDMPTGWDGRHWRRAIDRATGLTHAQVRVALHLENEYATWTTGGGIRPSCATVGESLGMSRQTVLGHLQALTAAGWLIVTTHATKRTPATYRLGYGEFRPIPSPVQTSEIPTSDVGDSDLRRRESRPQTSENPTRTPSFPVLRTPSLISDAPDVASEAHDNTPSGEERGEESQEKNDNPSHDFEAFIRAFPNRRCRTGTARENAARTYAYVLDEGTTHDDLMRVLNLNPPSEDTWADMWVKLTHWGRIDQENAAQKAAAAAAIKACDECDDHGWVEGRGQTMHGAFRCTHDPAEAEAARARGAEEHRRKEAEYAEARARNGLRPAPEDWRTRTDALTA